MNKQRLIEWGKSILIVLLLISALRLSSMVGLMDFSPEQVQINVPGTESSETVFRSEQAAVPLAIMITTAENAHHGIKYNGEAIAEVTNWLSASLGEALGSSGEPVEVSARKWEDALHGEGVFFDYLYEQSVSSLAHWLGVDIASDVSLHTSRRFCLAVENDAVAIYYIRALDGKAYRCDTALSAERLSERLEDYVPNGAMFAFEAGEDYRLIDPYYCILSGLGEISVLTAVNPLQNSSGTEILEKFGMNPLVASSYVEDDGTRVYVEQMHSLRLSGGGRVIYNYRESDENAASVGTREIISKAYELAASVPGSDSRFIQMSGISYDQDTGEYTVLFDYVVDGIVVCFGGRASAMEIVTDSSGAPVRADFMCRDYTSAEKSLPMPERQALAVISALGGGEPMLCYADNGESVDATWVIKH